MNERRPKEYLVGFDIGSTTAKLVVMEGREMVYRKYARHMAQVRAKAVEMLRDALPTLTGASLRVAVSGSAGLGLAQAAGLDYVQEVFASGEMVKAFEPDTDVVIELGGEDAKIIYFRGAVDERMNGSCAGGTGAFIDQMASLMDISPDELDELSLKAERIYPIASRCGVFAKTDVQPLINQGARKEDVAASIYQAVVNQTIAGLARGRRIEGKVMFLGGPLSYDLGLRRRFVETLNLPSDKAVFPEYARYSVAMGAALCAEKRKDRMDGETLLNRLQSAVETRNRTEALPPLFESREEYDGFLKRHARHDVEARDLRAYEGDAYLGVDCGSTTTKLCLIDREGRLLYSYYMGNRGNPVDVVREQLARIYELGGDRIVIRSSAATGYGEALIRAAFNMDMGLVETEAHLRAAKRFCPDVEFLMDIGGQDIKCFRIRGGAIDSILLNEACSSGCGSFLETFAHTMGMNIADFAREGLFARNPVDLGSRCTVFMNSSVKQAQKDGRSLQDISAGLSMSVVANALYKVVRIHSAKELGERIVVQGGTFLNDAVLRAFEKQIGREVARPSIAGLMGAYGAALYAADKASGETSAILDRQALGAFYHQTRASACHGCENHCPITINRFSGSRTYVSGNRCERIFKSGQAEAQELPNLHKYKRERLAALTPRKGRRAAVGMPLGLNLYELAPFWYAFFTALDFGIAFSGFPDRASYSRGQQSIPSDTACYPAKLMHGQMAKLLDAGVDAIFYPCATWNVDEGRADNSYNCPLVAYYPELLADNMDELRALPYLHPFLNLNDRRELARELHRALLPLAGDLGRREVRRAVDAGFEALDEWKKDVRRQGEAAIELARRQHRKIMILAGRPYHADPMVGHGVDELAGRLGFVVVSEDSVAHLAEKPQTVVMNQWTYHARLYAAARFAVENKDVELVQLVSFGCGLDAITSDEVREILEDGGKLYTQLKIDEITNLGAVTIRLRSLMSAMERREAGGK